MAPVTRCLGETDFGCSGAGKPPFAECLVRFRCQVLCLISLDPHKYLVSCRRKLRLREVNKFPKVTQPASGGVKHGTHPGSPSTLLPPGVVFETCTLCVSRLSLERCHFAEVLVKWESSGDGRECCCEPSPFLLCQCPSGCSYSTLCGRDTYQKWKEGERETCTAKKTWELW